MRVIDLACSSWQLLSHMNGERKPHFHYFTLVASGICPILKYRTVGLLAVQFAACQDSRLGHARRGMHIFADDLQLPSAAAIALQLHCYTSVALKGTCCDDSEEELSEV